MIRYVNGRFDNYSISPLIRQVLLHCSYELVENDLLSFIFFVHIKMSYCQLNKDRLLEQAKHRYHNDGGKEKAVSITKAIKKF